MLCEERKAGSPQPSFDFSLRPVLLHPSDSTIPIVPTGLRTKGAFGTNMYSGFLRSHRLCVGGNSVGQIGRKVPGACQAWAGGRVVGGQPNGVPTPRGDISCAIIQISTLMGTPEITVLPLVKYSRVETPSAKCWGCLLPLE